MVASYSEQIKAIRHQRRQAVLAHWLTFRSVMSRSAYAEMMGVPPRAVPRIDAPDWDVDEATWPVLEERLPGDWLAVQRPPAFADASFDEAARDRTGRIVQAVEFWKASRQFFDNRFADAVRDAGLFDYATIVSNDGHGRLVLVQIGARLPLCARDDQRRRPGRVLGRPGDSTLTQLFAAGYRRVMAQGRPILQRRECAVGAKWYSYLSFTEPIGRGNAVTGAIAVASVISARDIPESDHVAPWVGRGAAPVEGAVNGPYPDQAWSGSAERARSPGRPLTPGEIAVLRWAAQGKTNAQIATITGRSPATSTFHLKNAMRKLNAVNRTQAAIRAAQLGYLHHGGDGTTRI